MNVFLGLAYFVVGIVQLFAIMDGIGYALSVGSVLSFVIALFVTYIPLLGSVLGVYGATQVWDWSLLQSLALFFWYVPVAILVFGYSAIFER
jgi:hypothetical protein